MKSITAFRSASVLLFVFCLMHTGGGMLAQKGLGPASDAVFEAMKSVHFEFNGADCTWYGFWFGFGLTTSIFLLLSSFVAWEFERIPSELWPRLQFIAWAFVVSHVANTVLAWKYFFAGPGVFGIIISLLLAVGTLRKSRRVTQSRLAGT
ncbi:MAG TPA: hypothetical protein VER11_23880 [Polyangiaceae bacterium]|nr:hypothetical protein [Polyangiaceae bacterium]